MAINGFRFVYQTNTKYFYYLKVAATAGGDGTKRRKMAIKMMGRNMYMDEHSVSHFPTCTIVSLPGTQSHVLYD